MKITLAELRSIINQQIRESVHDVNEFTDGASLDAQVDRYFSEYEKQGKGAKQEGRDLTRLWRRILNEADDDDGGDDEKANDVKPVSPEQEADQQKMSTHDIDVEGFANDVARLIDNHDHLLEFQNTILKRAVNFLNKSYDNDVIDAFKSAIKSKHSMSIDQSDTDVDNDEYKAPRAGEAGPL